MRRIARDDAIKALGPVDDAVIAQIIGTGATRRLVPPSVKREHARTRFAAPGQ
jgi:hypothetical protein